MNNTTLCLQELKATGQVAVARVEWAPIDEPSLLEARRQDWLEDADHWAEKGKSEFVAYCQDWANWLLARTGADVPWKVPGKTPAGFYRPSLRN